MKLYRKWALGCSAIAAAMCLVTARAVFPQSDVTGTNTWNDTTPIFEIESQLDPETLAQAREFSQALNDAYAACVASVEEVSTLPRRFTRQPREEEGVCISAECVEYNRLLEEAKTFLSRLDIPEEERLRAIQNLRTW
ncbi:hypothetical protein [Phormidium sp. CCY1219]|uniref:hypothetical protein n=1 Tax=Phormidium sp. CCY1219 TaxID=2886104 RepID=UPI002D1E826D|nr:hypothetical protein [Phormidium sp. CCY1219]MEB3830082.1 hypothetical protein [Phormidium sp. CCY1219]